MERIRKSWYERDFEETEKITKDWVKTNCRLTKRELELLEIIHKRKLVRRDHLEIISPSYRNLGRNRTIIINRAIRRLFRSMCIDKAHERKHYGEGGNHPCIVSLDRAGSIILGVNHRRRIIHSKHDGYITRRLPSNYRHFNGVNMLEVETILHCEETGNELLEWVHEKPQEFFYGQEKVNVIPDISMTLKFNTGRSKTFYAYIEFDTSSESPREKEPRIIRDKIIKYKKLKMSRIWEKDYPVFPALVFVGECEKRTEFWTKKCRENGLFGIGVHYENYSEFLNRIAEM